MMVLHAQRLCDGVACSKVDVMVLHAQRLM